ncbi:MAG: galactose oxidase [Acidobacteria bacterium]|nr:galactose oxidase [Acidobacteriota bacterium]
MTRLLLIAVALAFLGSTGGARLAIVALPELPDAVGRAGMFAGRHGDRLFAAGGANFPNGMPWDGGTKVWHDEVFALTAKDARWRIVGRLPARNAYGVSATTREGVVLAGGSDAERHVADVWLMSARADDVSFTALPALPIALAQMSGARVGRVLHVVGGIDRPDAVHASSQHFALDLDALDAGWKTLPPLPSDGRILATAAVVDDALYVIGGCALRAGSDGRPVRTYLRHVWRYRAGRWTRLADLPAPNAAAASPAPVFGRAVFLAGGDDGTQVGRAPTAHVGFGRRVFRYDVAQDRWHDAGELPSEVPVTVPTAPWRDGVALVSGEVRPGVRTPHVTLLRAAD